LYVLRALVSIIRLLSSGNTAKACAGHAERIDVAVFLGNNGMPLVRDVVPAVFAVNANGTCLAAIRLAPAYPVLVFGYRRGFALHRPNLPSFPRLRGIFPLVNVRHEAEKTRSS
jgi:hypothetical protein